MHSHSVACVPWNNAHLHNYFVILFTYRLSMVSKSSILVANTYAAISFTSAVSQLASPKEVSDRQFPG